jgi:hypothetical protein
MKAGIDLRPEECEREPGLDAFQHRGMELPREWEAREGKLMVFSIHAGGNRGEG